MFTFDLFLTFSGLKSAPMEWLRTPEMLELMNAGLLYKAGYYLESIQKGTPPPHLGSAKCLLPP